MPFFEPIFRRLYVAVAEVTWGALALAVLAHALLSWVFLVLAGEEGLTGSAATWTYYYVTTATTVGYGDLSPGTDAGRLLASAWVLPGSIALFGAVLGKAVADLGDFWRKRMNGHGDYSARTGHTVVLGWQGARTRRLIELLLADRPDGERIVLVAKTLEQNPMPDALDYVRADALSTPRGHERAGLAGASSVVIRGEDDDETLAATLAAARKATDAHVVAHFEDERAAELIQQQCPDVEAIGSLSAELLVRSARDPGASKVADRLFSATSEDTAFSLTVPAAAGRLGYLDALVGLKRAHDMTVVGIGHEHGRDVDLNCPPDRTIEPGEMLFYIADRRIDAGEIDWPGLTGGWG